MKPKKILIALTGAVILWGCGYAGLFGFYFVHHALVQQKAAQAVFDNLTPKHMEAWAALSEELWTKLKRGDFGTKQYVTIAGPDLPRELVELKMLRIDVINENRIDYLWLSGMDNTGLVVEKAPDGSVNFTAEYDDQHSKKLGAVSLKTTAP